jgi:hypothetical protein
MANIDLQIQEIPPRFEMEALPAGERHAAHLVQTNLVAFASHVQAFKAALSLFDFCLPQMSKGPAGVGEWAFVAARDGVMSIYHAYTVLDGIRQTVVDCPTLNEMIDRQALRAAGKIFHDYFRTFEDMRDAVGHVGEKMKTPEKFAEHSYSGSVSTGAIKAEKITGLTMSNILDGRRFTNTWEGKILTCDISQRSLDRLGEAKQHLWAALRRAEHGTKIWLASARLVGALRRYAALSKPDEPQT